MQSSPLNSLAALPRLLYNHNPFYFISASLVLYGIYRVVPPDASASGGWLLLGMLGGYTLLLALAGYAIVRAGRVWDDARMILLVLVLLFVALSVGFDRIVLDNPAVGARFLLLALAYACAISEGVLRSLRIRLTWPYRGPYYLILMLLFCFPVLLGQISKSGWGDNMPWCVLLFPVTTSLALWTLLPAARATEKPEPPPGAPWDWPYYPWSLFVCLLVAISLRSYSLSLGFESGHAGQSSFQPYFLVPLAMSVTFLLLELGITGRSRLARNLALLAPLGLLWLALPGQGANPVAARFLATLCATLGSPLQLTAIGCAIFYAVAWLRGVRHAEVGWVACLTLLTVVDRGTVSPDTLAAPHWLAPACVAAVEAALWLRERRSSRATLAALYGIAAIVFWNGDRELLAPTGIELWHLAALTVFSLGALCDDRWARLLRRFTWPLITVVGAVAAWKAEAFAPVMPRVIQAGYLSCLAALAAAYWYREPALRRLIGAAGSLLVLTSVNFRWVYLELEESRLAPGLPWLAWGSASMTLALLVSFAKAGVVGRLLRWLLAFDDEARRLGRSNDFG